MTFAGYTETEQLGLFLERAEALTETRMLKARELQNKLSIDFDAVSSQMRVDAWRPDDDTVEPFLLRFRHFWGQREPANAKRIASILYNNIEGDCAREQLRRAKEHWRGTQGSGLGLVINDESYQPEFVMDLMVNGVYFHSDSRLRRKAKELDWLSDQFVRHVMIDYLIAATRYIMFLRSVILISRAQGLLRL